MIKLNATPAFRKMQNDQGKAQNMNFGAYYDRHIEEAEDEATKNYYRKKQAQLDQERYAYERRVSWE